MNTKNILIFGKHGQLAWELFVSLSALGNVRALGSRDCDIAQADEIRAQIGAFCPKIVINAAAYTAVDKAESEPDLAFKLNAIAPGIMAQECARLGIPFVHFSTDYVFNGNSKVPYSENEGTDPRNVYGKSKRDGETAILESNAASFIFRTSWVYGTRGKNFLRTMRQLAREKKELRVVNDQFGSPTWSRSIAIATAVILSKGNDNLQGFTEEFGGIYHLTSAGETSWYEFAKTIFQNDAFPEEHKIETLIPIATSSYPTPAKRPQYSVLSNLKTQDVFGINLPNWNEQLNLVLQEISQK